jgi:hypothetical protein
MGLVIRQRSVARIVAAVVSPPAILEMVLVKGRVGGGR